MATAEYSTDSTKALSGLHLYHYGMSNCSQRAEPLAYALWWLNAYHLHSRCLRMIVSGMPCIEDSHLNRALTPVFYDMSS